MADLGEKGVSIKQIEGETCSAPSIIHPEDFGHITPPLKIKRGDIPELLVCGSLTPVINYRYESHIIKFQSDKIQFRICKYIVTVRNVWLQNNKLQKVFKINLYQEIPFVAVELPGFAEKAFIGPA